MGLVSPLVPASYLLVGSLAYGSQALFYFIEPGPLSRQEFYVFNILVLSTYLCYTRAWLVNPGSVPKGWKPRQIERTPNPARWCKKCEAPKPPRAHHCKVCKRCVPKMDHHCPWTANCVSHRTFPHFIRFLFWGVVSMIYLTQLLYTRMQVVWNDRHLPGYLGPSGPQLAALFLLCIGNGLTFFGVGIIFLRTAYCLATNVTAIESWEIERHAVLARRARKYGGYLEGADGSRVRIVKQEFPYDIGIWQNIWQGMGGSPLTWLLPFDATPSVDSGLEFEVNDFNDPGLTWPPPDPDKLPRAAHSPDFSAINMELDDEITDQDRRRAFRERQEADLRRRATRPATWKNSEGEALEDFGVDEEAEDDDIPIAELLKRRRQVAT